MSYGALMEYRRDADLEKKLSACDGIEAIQKEYDGAILEGDAVTSKGARYDDIRGAERVRKLYNMIRESEIGRAILGDSDTRIDGFAYLSLGSTTADVVNVDGRRYLAVNKKLAHAMCNLADKVETLDRVPETNKSEYVQTLRTMGYLCVRAHGEGNAAKGWKKLKGLYGRLRKKAENKGDKEKAEIYSHLERDAEDNYQQASSDKKKKKKKKKK